MTEKSIEELIAKYRQNYKSAYTSAPQRLPFPLNSEEDTRIRLLVLYQLEVEHRGKEFVEDENTMDKIKKVAKWMFSTDKRGLILMGTMGNGKSTMLKAIIRLFTGFGTSLGNAQDIFDHFKRSQGSMKYWDEPLLLIDDMGVEPIRCIVFGEEYLPISRLLLHRYDMQLTTIIATNLDLEQIGERYGDRIVDRLNETYNVILYDSESYR